MQAISKYKQSVIVHTTKLPVLMPQLNHLLRNSVFWTGISFFWNYDKLRKPDNSYTSLIEHIFF